MPEHAQTASTQAERLARIRKAYAGDSQVAFVEMIGESIQRWNNYEHGRSIGIGMAIKLVQLFPGLTLDWIYLGDPSGLPVEMARKLGELPPAPDRKVKSRA